MASVFISIGTNNNREHNYKRVLKVLGNLFDVLKISKTYLTKPVGFGQNEYYLNGIIKIETDLKPNKLLEKLQLIENQFGRNRIINNGPTTMDLDIIYYNNLVVDTPMLQIPHYKIYQRGFVLIPLNEIEPNFVDPIKNKTIQELLKEIKVDKEDVIVNELV